MEYVVLFMQLYSVGRFGVSYPLRVTHGINVTCKT